MRSASFLLPSWLLTRALAALAPLPDYLLTDYLIFPNSELSQTALVKGDRLSLSVAGASVLAKTARDALMLEMDSTIPATALPAIRATGLLSTMRPSSVWGYAKSTEIVFHSAVGAELPAPRSVLALPHSRTLLYSRWKVLRPPCAL